MRPKLRGTGRITRLRFGTIHPMENMPHFCGLTPTTKYSAPSGDRVTADRSAVRHTSAATMNALLAIDAQHTAVRVFSAMCFFYVANRTSLVFLTERRTDASRQSNTSSRRSDDARMAAAKRVQHVCSWKSRSDGCRSMPLFPQKVRYVQAITGMQGKNYAAWIALATGVGVACQPVICELCSACLV